MNRRIGAAALAAILTLLSPAAAMAQTDTSTTSTRPAADIDQLKSRALAAIQARLDRIDRLQEIVAGNPHLNDDHQASLEAEMGRSEAGLEALAEEIRAAATVEELRALIPKIAEDFRIYLLVSPKVHLVIAADTVVDAADRFHEVGAKLAEAIARAEGAGHDVTQAKEALARFEALVAEAEALAGPVPGLLLPLTPQDWPDPAQGMLADARADLASAHAALRDARQVAEEVVKALRQAT
jgi:hypothetical protein